MNEYLEEVEEVMDDITFGESYDKELSTYEGGYDEGRLAGYDDGYESGKEDGYEVGKKEGYSVGKEEGYNTGKEELKRDVVVNLLKNNISLKIISDTTGYSITELEKLKKEI